MRPIGKCLLDIRLWIVLFFLVRLIGITDPPLGSSHNWRQATVTMVARNFFEIDNNILYPRIDIGGSGSGITGMEFPILNYLIYLVSLIFGYEHWYGRPIVSIVSCFGILAFHRIVQRHATPRIAFLAAILLLCSIWFSFSRMIMPDVFSMSLILIGLYHGSVFLFDRAKILPLLLFALFTMLGALSKLPSAYLLIVLLIPLLDARIQIRRQISIGIVLAMAVIPAFIWYFHWVPRLIGTSGLDHFFMGKGLSEGMDELIANADLVLHRFTDGLKYLGLCAFLIGIIIAFKERKKILVAILALASIGFLFVMMKAGFTFAHHSYYIIPFVPIMALVAAFALDRIRDRRILFIVLFMICIESILGQLHRFQIDPDQRALLRLEADLDQFSDPSDLILINSDAVPTPMYFAHRKGWIGSNTTIAEPAFLSSLRSEGLKYVVILKKTFGSPIELDLPIMLENEHYRIYGF